MFIKRLSLLVVVSLLGAFGCSNEEQSLALGTETANLYSMDGREHQVHFEAFYLSSFANINQLDPEVLIEEIKETTNFLFGPLTIRKIAGIQKGEIIDLHLEKSFIKNNRVVVPYTYNGVWLIHKDAFSGNTLQVPVPYSVQSLRTKNWKSCTDSEDEHSSWSFFWYYWDPERSDCDHKLHSQYQDVTVEVGIETVPTRLSFPEYQNLIRTKDGKRSLAVTFAFGYIKDVAQPDPFNDQDYGMYEFQRFYSQTKRQLESLGFTEKPIYQKDITYGSARIGAKFSGNLNGLQTEVSIVAAAGVDQMDLFADSYAKKHEGFFGWFGHSRVGSGFDADQFRRNVEHNPETFSLSSEYQMIYWAGCNSYSYYTLPFFEMKAEINPVQDPNGTKKLDLISNALPSLFSFNAYNAGVLLQALLNWQNPTSYQVIINKIETFARSRGFPVIASVLGDEDNEKNQ